MDFEEGNFEELPKMEPTDEENNDHEARQEARQEARDVRDALQNENARFNFGYKIQVYDTRFYFYGLPNIFFYKRYLYSQNFLLASPKYFIALPEYFLTHLR